MITAHTHTHTHTHTQLEESSASESERESEMEEDERLSFRHSEFTQSYRDEPEEGDLGLGTDRHPLEKTEESQF